MVKKKDLDLVLLLLICVLDLEKLLAFAKKRWKMIEYSYRECQTSSSKLCRMKSLTLFSTEARTRDTTEI